MLVKSSVKNFVIPEFYQIVADPDLSFCIEVPILPNCSPDVRGYLHQNFSDICTGIRSESMSSVKRANAADDAAEAFYGQNETNFNKQLSQICASDPRLIKVFQRTRANYNEKRASRN